MPLIVWFEGMFVRMIIPALKEVSNKNKSLYTYLPVGLSTCRCASFLCTRARLAITVPFPIGKHNTLCQLASSTWTIRLSGGVWYATTPGRWEIGSGTFIIPVTKAIFICGESPRTPAARTAPEEKYLLKEKLRLKLC